ncbi:MAG: hypothetical protein LBT14_05005 [Treponema sp.]|nr:hypothetical protein [Treponema sp.]
MEKDLREKLGLCIAPEINADTTIFGFRNKNWKPWTMPTGLEVLVSDEFITTVYPKTGYTYIYPQGRADAPPSGRLPPNGFYFDNCFRTLSEFDEDHPGGRADFAEDYKACHAGAVPCRN